MNTISANNLKTKLDKNENEFGQTSDNDSATFLNTSSAKNKLRFRPISTPYPSAAKAPSSLRGGVPKQRRRGRGRN